jgi:hypothetical protein
VTVTAVSPASFALATEYSSAGPYACEVDVDPSSGEIVQFDCTATANTHTMTFVSCAVFDLSDGGNRKRASFSTSPTTSGTFAAASAASADPHLRGAHGVKYEFSGQANATYALFSSQQFVVNMHLAADGPALHFITQIGVVFRNLTMKFSTFQHGKKFVSNLDKQLRVVGGRAIALSPIAIRLELCPGHSITIMQRYTVQGPLVHADGTPFRYLNVEIAAPGCHNSYDGALGQTYKCKYLPGLEKFVFDEATEESFRVRSIFSPSGAFQPGAPCHDQDVYNGQSSMRGSTVDRR